MRWACCCSRWSPASGRSPSASRSRWPAPRSTAWRGGCRRWSPRCRRGSTAWSRACSPPIRNCGRRALAPSPTNCGCCRRRRRRRRRRSAWWAWTAAAVVVAGRGRVGGCGPRARSSRHGDRPPVIAVLPLENATGDDANDYLAAGVADSLVTSLASLPTVTVLSRAAVDDARQRRGNPADIARDLDASFVVEGSVRRAGPQVRLALNLLRQDGSIAWSDAVEGPADGVFGMQARLAGALGSALSVQMSATESGPAEHAADLECRRAGCLLARPGTARAPRCARQPPARGGGVQRGAAPRRPLRRRARRTRRGRLGAVRHDPGAEVRRGGGAGEQERGGAGSRRRRGPRRPRRDPDAGRPQRRSRAGVAARAGRRAQPRRGAPLSRPRAGRPGPRRRSRRRVAQGAGAAAQQLAGPERHGPGALPGDALRRRRGRSTAS